MVTIYGVEPDPRPDYGDQTNGDQTKGQLSSPFYGSSVRDEPLSR